MVRQPRESVLAQSEVDSLEEGADESAGSRRDFLQLSAFSTIGFLAACTSQTPGDDDAITGGTGGTGTGGTGTGGTGAAAGTGGTGTGGTGTGGTGTGGTGTGGTGTGGTGTGGTGTGGTGTGGTGTGGTGTGGSGATAGTGNPAGGASGGGGSPATGGTSPGGGRPGMGGMPGTGGTGMGGMPGAGGTGNPATGGWHENQYTPLPAVPDGTHGPSNKMLPDPFKFMNGMRIATKADWEKLRADLSAMLQAAVYGPKMPQPDKLDASFSGGKVTVNMTVGSKTSSFSFSVSGGSTTSPKPAVIKVDGSGCPFPSSVVSITIDTKTIGNQDKSWPPGGVMKDLYGNTAAKCGSDIAWAWGASRIIDALEKCPDAGIDPTRIATTGCSYAGKGALCIGAFDERIALTVMEEGGSGGSALWRVSNKEASLGQNIQEATEIVGEQNWEGKDFHDLFSGKTKGSAPVDMLIADQHFAVALCAPRAVLLIENDIDWLGPVAAYGGGVAAREVFTALGITDRIGISVAANHAHCSFPTSQQADLTNFINRFLLGMKADTSGVDLLNATNSKLKTFNKADWIDWTTPTLSGDLPWDPFAGK